MGVGSSPVQSSFFMERYIIMDFLTSEIKGVMQFWAAKLLIEAEAGEPLEYDEETRSWTAGNIEMYKVELDKEINVRI